MSDKLQFVDAPCPFGRGRGEGIAEPCKNLIALFLGRAAAGKRIKMWLASLSPHPNPFPKGEGT